MEKNKVSFSDSEFPRCISKRENQDIVIHIHKHTHIHTHACTVYIA